MLKTITLHPSRIGCPSLPGTMKGIVSSIPGVHSVVVRYEERALDVTYDDGVASLEGIIEKIGAELGIHMEAGAPGVSKPGSASETCPM